MDRINPKYFDYLDRKIDYLNAQGFIPFIEVSRRDSSPAWKKYYAWPDSYARYIEYIFARYQANTTLLSPIHFDTPNGTIPAADYKPAIQLVLTKYGPPPFGTLLTANANPSTLVNWGQDSWVTLHQTGNRREHDFYWYLTEIYHALVPQPAINGEPYYAGYKDARGKKNGGYQYGAVGGRHLGRGCAGRCPSPYVGRLSMELRVADEAFAHLRIFRRKTVAGTDPRCGPGFAQQDARD